MRGIEIRGFTGVLLAPKIVDHLDFYEFWQEVFIYEDGGLLVNEVKQILIQDNEDTEQPRIKVQAKVVNDFTYKLKQNTFFEL
jgi:hypothetical protein